MKQGNLFRSLLLMQLSIIPQMTTRPTGDCVDCDDKDTQNRTKRFTQDYDYSEYYDDIEIGIIEEKKTLQNNIIAPPGLNIDTAVRSLSLSKDLRVNIELTPRSPKEAPDYMMELYDRFSKNRLNHPSSNIVRSFSNINNEDPTVQPINTDLSGKTTRVHTMVFNITSISLEENIDLAELRLYTLVQRDRIMYIGVDRKVSVYEVMENDSGFHLIDSKHIYGRDSAWETFDVTSAVRRWVQQFSSVQILEIRIESVFHSVSIGDLDILTQNSNKNEPLLVVFSSDDRKRKLHENERHELVTHEMDMYDVQDGLSVDSPSNDNTTDDSNSDILLSRFKRRGRRHAVCRRKPMYVSFEEINWDSWIIAPRGYQAYECTGRCYFPLSDHLSPTKHAIIQSLVHASKPRKVSRVCCVPTKLDPISILYIDEQGIVTYKYKYEGMVVSECGCR